MILFRYLQPDYSKAGKRKTAMKKRTLNPDFHEEFKYNVSLNALSERSLEVTVWDHNMTRNVFLGESRYIHIVDIWIYFCES